MIEEKLKEGWLTSPLDFYGQGMLKLEPKPSALQLEDVLPRLGTTVCVRISGDVVGVFLLGAFHTQTDGMLEEMANVMAARLVNGLGDLDVMISPPERIDPLKAAHLRCTHCYTLWHEEGASRTPLFAAVALVIREGEAGHA
mgnify:CR=1 FL=1